jgi:hypothetical protein
MLTCNRSREEKPNGVELLASILHLTKLQNIIQSYTTLGAQTKFSSGGGTRCDISNTAQGFRRWHPKKPLPIAKPLLFFDLHNEKNRCVYTSRGFVNNCGKKPQRGILNAHLSPHKLSMYGQLSHQFLGCEVVLLACFADVFFRLGFGFAL